MKKTFVSLLLFVLSSWLGIGPICPAADSAPLADGEVWTMGQTGCWGNEKGCATLTVDESVQRDGHATKRFDYTGEKDWAATPVCAPIPVQRGEIYEVSCAVKVKGTGSAQTGGVLLNGSEVVSWIHGGKSISGDSDWTVLTSKFIVGHGVTAFRPRFTGAGAGSFWFDQYTVKKVGKLEVSTEDKVLETENRFLKLEFHTINGALCVTDKRTGRVWRQDTNCDGAFITKARIDSNRRNVRRIDFMMILPSFEEVLGSFELVSDKPEIVFHLGGNNKDADLSANLAYPLPFMSQPGDRIIVPMNEGISYPVEEPNVSYSLVTYGGHGICMAFWGVMEDVCPSRDKTGASYMAIFETSDDALLRVQGRKDSSEKAKDAPALLSGGPVWVGQKGRLAYDRSLRYVFFDGSEKTQPHVTICKRYREYVKETGLYVPFSEKTRRNPALKDGFDLLIGAVNVWFMGGKNKIEMAKELQESGIERILWSAGGSAEELTALNNLPNVLTSRYDIYQDIMNPEHEKEIGYWHNGWAKEAWPNDLMRTKDGDWTKGWRVALKDKTKPMIPCGVLCDCKAPEYAMKRIAEELKTKPYKARFIDTTTASPWRECYSPDHPLTRTESRVWKMKLLELMGREFNLVCGAETGHEASVPYCDFYEGMMSLGMYRVPDSGRNLLQIWGPDEVPEKVAKFQVGETYRLPLWELVYHDCTVSYWYWGDYNNKLPSLWDKRDLFNALYGVPPMFLFTYDIWKENKARFIESYKVSEPVSRLTGFSEMTDHRILSADRKVQSSTFANGTTVWVNFGNADFTTANGLVIPAGKSIVR